MDESDAGVILLLHLHLSQHRMIKKSAIALIRNVIPCCLVNLVIVY
jgi:hypothetical protein